MCGFIFTATQRYLTDQALDDASQQLRRRGPDSWSRKREVTKFGQHLSFTHFLLDISGSSVVQPYTSHEHPGYIVLFNGELYQVGGESKGGPDTLQILPHFLSDGPSNFASNVSGEFVILVYDEHGSELNILTDPFLTKPVFLGRGVRPTDFVIASYPSAPANLGFFQTIALQPNSHLTIKLTGDSISIQENFPMQTFELNQVKTHYGDWEDAFLEAVRKRATHGAEAPMLCLSSGYDSGAIALGLNLRGLKYHSYSLESGENDQILAKRIKINSSQGSTAKLLPGLSKLERKNLSHRVGTEVEPYLYEHLEANGRRLLMSLDAGALGAFYIAELAKRDGFSVGLSGSGADEIISDYGFDGIPFYSHSQFGGKFPQKMQGFFPWDKFYGNTQRSYLFKEELIFGHFGIESRYPFLDKDVVQEFLSLDPDWKNRQYKGPIASFLDKHHYPYENSVKRGFNVQRESAIKSIKKKLGSLFT
jgi:asparagine synthetase B (glutamine-hydrolysing)